MIVFSPIQCSLLKVSIAGVGVVGGIGVVGIGIIIGIGSIRVAKVGKEVGIAIICLRGHSGDARGASGGGSTREIVRGPAGVGPKERRRGSSHGTGGVRPRRQGRLSRSWGCS